MSTANTVLSDQISAPLWRRLAAMLYDSLLVFAIWMLVAFAILSAFGVDQARTVEGEAVTLDPLYANTLFVAMMISGWLFFAWFWTHSGQTLGMQAWRIRVVTQSGSAISWKQTILRVVIAPIALSLGGLGYWWALFDKQKRSWPDMVSDSKIIRVPN